MDPVGVNTIETAALGRPFQLGMLYDCRRDALVPGIRLWSKEQLEQNIYSKPQSHTVFTVTASDSVQEKSKLLNIDGGLKLSFLGGLVGVSGAANFLKDTKKSFSQQRLTVLYHSTTKFDELITNRFPSGEMAHYEDDVATHVVTAVLYGADSCFVFDRVVSSDEDKRVIEGEAEVALQHLKGISAGVKTSWNDNQKKVGQNFSCTFYGDFQLQCNPSSYEEALKVFEDLPKLLGENKELVVPLRAWLYPLDKLFSRTVKFQHEISISLSTDIECVIESLITTEMKCNDLLSETPALTFPGFYYKFNEMKKNCYQYRLSLMKKLGSLLPKIRGKFIEDSALIDLLNDHEESPFEGNTLEQWLKEKEDESEIIKSLITQLNDSEVKVELNLNKTLMNLDVKHLVSYTFTSLSCSDELLSEQKAYLRSSAKGNTEEKRSKSEHKTWLTPEVQLTMRNNLEVFKNLNDLNKSKLVMFIVTSIEIKNTPGSCILLYENGSNQAVCFTPPSKPDSPVIEDFGDGQVILKVSPSGPATEELKILYKMKEEKDWRSQPVSEKQSTVTLTDLRQDTEYCIKCAAVGKLNYTVDSDVTRISVLNQKHITAKESAVEHLIFTENKSSLFLQNIRDTIFISLHKKIQDMQQNCQTYRKEFTHRIQSVIQSVKACERESCFLTDLLQAHDESPFNEKSLKEWITVKETEVNTVNEILQQLMSLGAEVNRSLDSYLTDIQIENVFCYTFTSLEQPDELLNEQEKYMNHEMMRNEKKLDVASQSWLTGSIREKMKKHLTIFEELMTTRNSKFMISIKDHETHPGSCILVYKNRSNEAVCFTAPTKPDSPVIKDVGDTQVILKVSPSGPDTEELKILYKMKEEKDWRSQHVSEKQSSVTLTDLRSDTEYNIKCAAVGKLNYISESDVTTVITKKHQAGSWITFLRKQNTNDLIKKSILIKDGNPAQYRLQASTEKLDTFEPYRKMTFGERDKNKPQKTIMMVGETGTGKTTLINVMINYMLGVKREDNVWFEITDDQCDLSQVYSQTSIITVYEFYHPDSPIDLTIIDTPGYGNTHGIVLDKQIADSLLRLCKSSEGIHKIDVICLVILSQLNNLSDRQIYLFDAIQSLFGKDIAENIVLLFTHSAGAPPRNALTAVREAQIKCAVNDENQPVFFLFNNCQSEPAKEEYQTIQDQLWNLSYKGMRELFMFLKKIRPKSMKMTQDVLSKFKHLEAKISNLKSCVIMIELKQTKAALEQNMEHVKEKKIFEYEVEVTYKEKVDIDRAVARMAMCCTVCEENCHYPGCYWVSNLSWCSVMRNDHCTVCTNKCHYSKHVKGDKIYVTKTKKVKKTYDDLKKKCEDKIGSSVSLVKKQEEELQELHGEKIKQLFEAFHCVEKLQWIALNTDSLIILLHVDFLIQKLMEINEPEKADTLRYIKKRAGKVKQGALGNLQQK